MNLDDQRSPVFNEINKMAVGVICLLVFLLMALLMYSRKISAILALPVMAVAISIIGGIPPAEILADVINKGAVRLHATYTTTMFGAILAELMNKNGIAKSLVRFVAEFAYDNPYVLGLMLTLTTALLFSTLGGLGAVIMVGTIILPVMRSLGIDSITAGALYLFGISLGGMFNIAGWQLYMDVLKIQTPQIVSFVVPFALFVGLILLIFLAVELRNWKNWKYFLPGLLFLAISGYALNSRHENPALAPAMVNYFSIIAAFALLIALIFFALWRQRKNIADNSPLALATPFIPICLVLFFHWDFIPAFMAGIIYGTGTTWRRDSVNLLTRSIIDGIATVAPAVVLMIGIGMLIVAVTHPAVTSSIAPLLTKVVPTHALSFLLVFTILAPLALYRGPLSMWGMGSGLVAILQKATILSSQAIMAMIMSVGQIQGICDPTNTANIWIANYLGTDTTVLLRKTLPYAWSAVILGLALAIFMRYIPW